MRRNHKLLGNEVYDPIRIIMRKVMRAYKRFLELPVVIVLAGLWLAGVGLLGIGVLVLYLCVIVLWAAMGA